MQRCRQQQLVLAWQFFSKQAHVEYWCSLAHRRFFKKPTSGGTLPSYNVLHGRLLPPWHCTCCGYLIHVWLLFPTAKRPKPLGGSAATSLRLSCDRSLRDCEYIGLYLNWSFGFMLMNNWRMAVWKDGTVFLFQTFSKFRTTVCHTCC